MSDERRAELSDERRNDLLDALGGPQGIADSSLPALAFVIAVHARRNDLSLALLGRGRRRAP